MPLLNIYDAQTVTELHDKLTDSVISASQSIPTSGTAVGVSNVIGVANHFEWSYDLSKLWLVENKWRKIVNQYLDPVELDSWLNLIETRLTKARANIAVMRLKSVQGSLERSIVTRRFGSCMNYISYTSRPKPQITLDSRTCYLGYISGLDLTFAWKCAQLVARAINKSIDNLSFIWRLGIAQFNSENALGYTLHRDIDQYLSLPYSKGVYRLQETVRYIKDLDDKGVPYDEMRFASRRRLRQRYHLESYGPAYCREFGKAPRSLPRLLSNSLELI